jgi:hypothetical protein
MHNTKQEGRLAKIDFPMSEITNWDAYAAVYDAEQREKALRKVEKTKQFVLPGFDPTAYDEDHPAFGGPDWTEKEKADAERDLKRFLGRRGLLDRPLDV